MKKALALALLVLLVLIAEYFYLQQAKTYRASRSRRDGLRQAQLARIPADINKEGESITGKHLRFYELKELNCNNSSAGKGTARFKLVIMADLENDCWSCLSEYRLWNRVHEKHGPNDIAVALIGFSQNEDYLLSFVRDRNIEFLIYHDPDRKTLAGIGFPKTPIRILLDADNRILEAERCTDDISLYKPFMTKLTKLVSGKL